MYSYIYIIWYDMIWYDMIWYDIYKPQVFTSIFVVRFTTCVAGKAFPFSLEKSELKVIIYRCAQCTAAFF